MIKYIKEPQPRLPQHYATETLAVREHLFFLSFLGSGEPRLSPCGSSCWPWAQVGQVQRSKYVGGGGSVMEGGWQVMFWGLE